MIFNFQQWNDCFAWDYATNRLTKYNKVSVLDLGGGVNESSSHPLNDGPLGEYLQHTKGRAKLTK